MHPIMRGKSAPKWLLKAASPIANPSQTLAPRQISYSVLVRCRETVFSREKVTPQASVVAAAATAYSCHHSRALKRSFITSRHNEPATDSTMLSQYISRFMSTIQQTVSGVNAKHIEDDRIAALLAEPRANKRVQINACGPLYTELSRTKPILFGGAPHDGIQFDVEYYDSLESLSDADKRDGANSPTVCLLHGAPGQYIDFANLIYHLTRDGIRVIAPNFPDYSATFQHSFRHSPRERLEFLLEFFKAINLKQIDVLGGHSSAVYTMFELLNYNQSTKNDGGRKVNVKSLALFSTPSHVLPHNLAPTPFRMFTLKLFDYPILRPVIMALILTFAKLQGIRNRVDKDKIEDLLIAASAMGYSQHAKLADRLKLMQKLNMPAILIYGTRDRLITANNFKQLERDLGIQSEDQVKCYSSDGSVQRSVKNRHQLVDVSRFESGGHYTFQKYSTQVSEDIYKFLHQRVLSNNNIKEATKL